MRATDEQRFDGVFVHLDAVACSARRRGAPDPDDVAAECMAVAWRRLDDVPADDALPWLLGCARRIVLSQRRREGGRVALDDVAEPRGPRRADRRNNGLEVWPDACGPDLPPRGDRATARAGPGRRA